MKKIIGVFIANLAFSFSNAQESAIKANPIGFAFGIANVDYEFALNDTQTVIVSALFYKTSNVTGFGVGGEYRFYFSDEALRGWHAGPTAGFFSVKGSGSLSNTSSSIFVIGGEGGHQWILNEHFVIDAFATLGFISGGGDLDVSGIAPGIGASIGYAW